MIAKDLLTALNDIDPKLLEDVELLDVAGDPLDLDMILSGQLTPMFFGSAATRCGPWPPPWRCAWASAQPWCSSPASCPW